MIRGSPNSSNHYHVDKLCVHSRLLCLSYITFFDLLLFAAIAYASETTRAGSCREDEGTFGMAGAAEIAEKERL